MKKIKKNKALDNYNGLAFKMILPAIIAMSIVHYLPMIWGIYISFRKYNKFTIRNMPWNVDFIGFNNYKTAFQSIDDGFLHSMQITFSYVIISILLSVFLGLGAAILANEKFKGQTIFRGIVLIPYILPKVVYLTCLRFMFTYEGIINKILVDWLGILAEPTYWLIGKNTFWTIIVGNVWGRWPLFYMIFLAALQAIPQDMYEAASIDGASVWQKFRSITVPYIKGSAVIVILLNALWSFNDYIVPYIMLGGGYSTVPAEASLLSIEILRESFSNLNFGFGAAESVIMTVAAMIFVSIYLKRVNIQEDKTSLKKDKPDWLNFVNIATYSIIGIGLIKILGKDEMIKIVSVFIFTAACLFAIWLILKSSERVGKKMLSNSGRVLFLIVILFPIYWLVISSLKIESEVRINNLIPTVLAWSNYSEAFKQAPLARFFKNSALISLSAMILSVIIATLAGYAFSRFRFPGRKLFGTSVLLTQMFPGVLFLLPYFLIFSSFQKTSFCKFLNLKFIGSEIYGGNIILLIFTYIAFVLPFAIWIVKGFIDSIPVDLDLSAEIDGCTRFQAFRKVVLPSAIPGIITVAILAFMKGWNEVLFSSVLTNPMTRTVALGISDYRNQEMVQWNVTMAAGVMISIPVIIFFTLLQRYMVSGLTAGSVKE